MVMKTTSRPDPALPANVIVQEACLLNALGSSGLAHFDIGDEVRLDGVEARLIVITCGRGLYLDKAHDPSDDKRHTATPEDLARIEQLKHAVAARDRLIAARSERDSQPQMGADAIATAVARAVTLALAEREPKANRLL